MFSSLIEDLKPDPRIQDWFLIDSALYPWSLIVGYLIFSLYLGPKFMHTRQAFNLKSTIVVYNFLFAIFNACIFITGGYLGWFNTHSWTCEPVNQENNSIQMKILTYNWLFYLSRYVAFLDTMLLILTKQSNKITILHIIQHAIIPFTIWIGLKNFPGEHYTISIWIFSLIYTIIYFYFLIKENLPQNLKKYIKLLQMVQIAVIFLHSFNTIMSNCQVPKGFSYIILLHSILYLILFIKFDDKKAHENEPFFITVDNLYFKYQHFMNIFQACIPDQTTLYNDYDTSNNENNDKKMY